MDWDGLDCVGHLFWGFCEGLLFFCGGGGFNMLRILLRAMSSSSSSVRFLFVFCVFFTHRDAKVVDVCGFWAVMFISVQVYVGGTEDGFRI